MSAREPEPSASGHPRGEGPDRLRIFDSDLVDRVRASGGVWSLRGGQVLLPGVFGFCRGVKRALAMLEQACHRHCRGEKVLYLLGQIIHNPWVNEYFQSRCVRILSGAQMADLAGHVAADDCVVIPAFGVPPPIERELAHIGCEVIDTSCGDVRRLWAWAQRSVGRGYGLVIFGRPRHDETVVTKSRLAEAGGKFVVVADVEQARQLCGMITGRQDAEAFRDVFGPEATNAESPEPFVRVAQVSQTTMLYDETVEVRRLLREAFSRRFGPDQVDDRLLFEPTVCRATQDRQTAAIELCRAGLDLAVVVGGFGSSNTRHLYELARGYVPAVFIEDAGGIVSERSLRGFDADRNAATIVNDWLPDRRPLRLGVLAGASTPEAVIGQVMEKLARFLE